MKLVAIEDFLVLRSDMTKAPRMEHKKMSEKLKTSKYTHSYYIRSIARKDVALDAARRSLYFSGRCLKISFNKQMFVKMNLFGYEFCFFSSFFFC